MPPPDGEAHGDDAFVVFTPSGKRGSFPKGTPVLEAARYGADP